MPKSPDVYLHHIVDEIQYLETLRQFEDGHQLKSDPTLSRAVVRSLEIIGEAATNISEEFKNANPDIPWRKIIAFRNRVIHEYMGINYNIVVNILNDEVAPLKESISGLLDLSEG